ncbi:MAG: helix-turn-helix transcriptional regulator [Candidatus Acidiferrales bacterium]
MVPGACLRKVREQLGLTYRDVEQSSYELATEHGRPEFIIHISRLADFENGGVTPSLHKLYSLCAIYHLDIFEVCKWYDVPLEQQFHDAFRQAAPRTHLAAPPRRLRLPLRFDPCFDPRRTEYLTRVVEEWGQFEGAFVNSQGRYRYGFIGTTDHWMEPLLRTGCWTQDECGSRTAAGKMNSIGPFILWTFEKVIAAAGVRRNAIA